MSVGLPCTEAGVLRTSIVATLLIAGFGIAVGLLAGSSAIIFDGLFALADAGLTLLALTVSRLIEADTRGGRPHARRFSVGFWHLEPIVLALNGGVLTGVIGYAIVDAAASLLRGGRPLAFGTAIVYAVVVLAVCVGMSAFTRRANRTNRSEFVALDGRGWIVSGGITTALLAAFIAGAAVEGTPQAWVAPYVDPLALLVVSLVVLPVPLRTVQRALADILLVTPPELRNHVESVAVRFVAREGFLGHRAYVARVGRLRQVELYFIAPVTLEARALTAWDALRDEIGGAIGGEGPDRWLTIVFTTDREWAD